MFFFFLQIKSITLTQEAESTHLSQVVKVVLVVNPLVVGLHTVRLVGNVLDVGAKAVEELAFKQLPVKEQGH